MGKSEREEKIKANLEKFNKMAAELDDEKSKKKKSKKSKKEHRKREHTPEKEVSATLFGQFTRLFRLNHF